MAGDTDQNSLDTYDSNGFTRRISPSVARSRRIATSVFRMIPHDEFKGPYHDQRQS